MKKLIPISTIIILGSISLALAKPQGNGPGGPPSHAQFMEQFDTDGDGKLSKEERENAKKVMEAQGMRPGGPREAMRQRLIEEFDADGDGELTGEERKAAREAVMKRRAVQMFDEDGDGELNEEEMAAVRAHMQQRRLEMLERFDVDGDGKLNREERRTARETMQEEGEHFGPPPPPGGKDKGKRQGKGKVAREGDAE